MSNEHRRDAAEETNNSQSSMGASSLRVQACDACKARKVKCDKNSPCSSCVASKIPCQVTKRAPEKRQRIVLSSRYGDEIADVNKRLEELSRTIRLLVESKPSAGDKNPSPATTSSGLLAPRDGSDPTSSEMEIPYEGDTSSAAQFKSMAETFDVAFQNSPQTFQNPQLSAANSRIQLLLREVTDAQASASSPSAASDSFSHYPALASLTLVPVGLVLKMLKLAKDSIQRFFIDFPCMFREDFQGLCQNIYFPAEDYSIAVWIIVHCGLFYLFVHCEKDDYAQLGLTSEEVDGVRKQCATNADSATQRLRLCTDPSMETTEALMLASSMYMDLARPAIAWKLVSAASRMCLDMGLHRQPANATGYEAKKKRLLFWLTYALDKGLALTFGRTPNIHDYDITVERPRPKEDFEGVWGFYYTGWMDYAELQGQILEQLFSAQAQRESQDVRSQRARALAARLKYLSQSFDSLSGTEVPNKSLMRDVLAAVPVVILSLETLIYRCIPPPQPAHPLQFCDDCVVSARKALNHLISAWQAIKLVDDQAWRMFVNWTMLFVPFVPVVVIFGNVIAQGNRQDMQLLEQVVEAMKAGAEVASSIEKLKATCERFCHIAQSYLSHQEAQSAADVEARAQPVNIDSTVDMNPNVVMTGGGNIPAAPGAFESLPDFPWDGMLSEWDLGLGAESAREMGNFFEQYTAAGGMGQGNSGAGGIGFN